MSTSRPGSTMTTTGAAASDQTITSPPAATIAPASQSQHRHHQSLAIEPSSSQQPHSSGSGSGSDARTATATQQRPRRAEKDRAADDAKLIFGTVFSLRNMARKLGGEDDAFISYRTAQYKLHYYETPTNLRFALLTEPAALSMRNVLHQIYINLWVEYVVKNPLSPAEHKGGEGVRNEMFEMGLDKFIRGLM
ncbi:Trafficking protein particle complex subunit BET5 [Diatrype stigma]|uniref:Trafficking protein particle complex subunit n=1 Tax=Diatrype stigma TaxID=117547 RepID=A0AAN9UPX4_9PEZI